MRIVDAVEQAPPVNGDQEIPRIGGWMKDRDRKIAHMTLAGLSPDAIARTLDENTELVHSTLRKESVQKYMLQLSSMHVGDIRPSMKKVSDAIAEATIEAQQTVIAVMREMRSNPDPKAQRVALSSAQDILDRAGHKPALRVEEAKVHAIHPETLRDLTGVLKELTAGGTS